MVYLCNEQRQVCGPVPEGCYHEFNIFLEKDLKYKGLLIDQVQVLRSFKNQEDILRRA